MCRLQNISVHVGVTLNIIAHMLTTFAEFSLFYNMHTFLRLTQTPILWAPG